MSRKNHKMVDGRLLQTDKKYSNLKMAQKEKINKWINEEICRYLDSIWGNIQTFLWKPQWENR